MSKIRKPNAAQANYLRRYMADHPQYVKGNMRTEVSKQSSNNMWDTLSKDLNSLGPPTRDKIQWKKVRTYIYSACLSGIYNSLLIYLNIYIQNTDMGRL